MLWRRGGYVSLLVEGLTRTALVTLGGLLFWAAMPIVLGWQPTVVMSDSMQPRIHPGDIIVAREVPASQLRTGQVLLVDDPADDSLLLLHRYDEATQNGQLILRGDANAEADSTPVSPEAVHGVGVLRVPWVGQPAVWASHGQYLPLIVTGLGSIGLLALTRLHIDPEDSDSGQSSDPASQPSPHAALA